MMFFDILKNLYCNAESEWILTLEDNEVNPVIIQQYLARNRQTQKVSRIMAKYAYTLPPKMYLSAVWTLLFVDGKKFNKMPFIKFEKKIETKMKYEHIIKKMQKQYKLSDDEIMVNKNILENEITKNKLKWFCYYAPEKKLWIQESLDFNELKKYNERTIKKQPKGLAMFV